VAAGGLARGPQYVTGLMWTPGVSALLTRLIFHRNARGLGWRWPGVRWAALAYLVPVAYATAAYAGVWLAGRGRAGLARFRVNALVFVVIGSLSGLFTATGEELGWRGFLVPALARTMPLGRTALISGGIWVVWHVPLVLFADYNQGTPKWYAVVC